MASRDPVGATKKAARQIPAPSTPSAVNPNSNQQQQGPVRTEPEEPQIYFFHEISDIMRGFGDCDRPLSDSVQLVENILQQQLKGILTDAVDIAIRRRGTPSPNQGDFEFLMRKHTSKINRMRKYIKDQKLLKRILNMQAGRSDESDGHQDSEEEIDNRIVEKYDEEKTRRMFRADRISQILSGMQYREFNEARRTSFYSRHSERMKLKFKSFLNIRPDTRISNNCLSILAYLAHETIATIVDYSILTRLNSENRITEPYSRVTPSGTSFNMFHLCPEVSQGRGQDGVKPITVQEINEAIRRHNMIVNRGMGFYRNSIDSNMRKSYLAI